MLFEIELNSIEVQASLGAYAWEINNPRPVSIDLNMMVEVGNSPITDDLQDTLNYDLVEKSVMEVALSRHFNLVESLAYEIAQALMKLPAISSLKVSVHKPKALANTKDVIVKYQLP